ncbi:hypothetical protein FSARC_5062 [Fusarium sarcochroum]|uniref:Uncharacterized protein n=1 Tax=Fusarium sarcochroum TaxID=1208366 RepID=A0A8H4X9X3_9HYPO|nr:hypothetical protein FSARC_5062 [Fusarium sarcochroum]
MASQSTKPSLLERMTIQLSSSCCATDQSDVDPLSPSGGDTVVNIPTFVYSNSLPTSEDDSDPTQFYLEDLAERVYRHGAFSVEESAHFTSPSWCSIMIFDTKGGCVVFFALQLNFTAEFQENKGEIAESYVSAFCSLVKWENRLVHPIDPEGRIANTDSSLLQQAIGESSETKIKEWMEETTGKVHE